jgi:hypothetical protein
MVHLPPEVTTTMTLITPQGPPAGTNTAPQDTMTARDPTALGVVCPPEVRAPLVGAIVLQVPVGGRGVQVPRVLEEGVDMEEITAASVVMMAINPAELPPATIATPRAEIVTALAAVGEGEGLTIPAPLPRPRAVTPPPRGPVGIRHLVHRRAAPTAVCPQENIRNPQLAGATAAQITTVGDPALVPASPDQNQPVMTVMDHRPAVVVVVEAVVLPTAADHLIVPETLGHTELPQMPAEVAVDMTRARGTVEGAATAVENLLRGALDRPLHVGPLVDIHQGAPLHHQAVSPLPQAQEPAIVPAAELVEGRVQPVELAGGLPLVTS